MALANVSRFGLELARAAMDARRGLIDLPPLTGMTLDADDARIAETWLKKRHQWADPQPVAAFEQAFAAWNGSPYALAFSGGRKALSACIHGLGLKTGDEVILPGYTC